MTGVKLDEPVLDGGDFSSRSRFEELHVPVSHEERMEWVKTSCERFFEKVRELDTLVKWLELH